MVCTSDNSALPLCVSLTPSCRAQLLHADVPPEPTPIDEEKAPADKENDTLDLGQVVEPHPDERQVRLDTDRSFVLYPVGEPPLRPRAAPPCSHTPTSCCRRYEGASAPAGRAVRPDCEGVSQTEEVELLPGASARCECGDVPVG